MRKIIQVAPIYHGEGSSNLYAVCDDGKILHWSWERKAWTLEVEMSIVPQRGEHPDDLAPPGRIVDGNALRPGMGYYGTFK